RGDSFSVPKWGFEFEPRFRAQEGAAGKVAEPLAARLSPLRFSKSKFEFEPRFSRDEGLAGCCPPVSKSKFEFEPRFLREEGPRAAGALSVSNRGLNSNLDFCATRGSPVR